MKHVKQVLVVGLSLGSVLGIGAYCGLSVIGAELTQGVSAVAVPGGVGEALANRCGLEPCIDTSSITEPLSVDLEKAENTGGLLVTELGTLQY